MSQATTQYRDDWRKVIYDATGDFVKTQRAMELAELNGLFDPIDAIVDPHDHAPPCGDMDDCPYPDCLIDGACASLRG